MTPRPSVWHAVGRALGVVAAPPARAVGLTIAHRPQLIPILIHARLLLDWQHAHRRSEAEMRTDTRRGRLP